jgi:hypothetical protein
MNMVAGFYVTEYRGVFSDVAIIVGPEQVRLKRGWRAQVSLWPRKR